MTAFLKITLLASATLVLAAMPGEADAAQAAQPSAPPATTACTAEHAAMGHCTLPAAPQKAAPVPAPAPPPAASCPPEHAAMGHCTPAPAPKAQTTCLPEHAAMGHCTLPATPPAAAPAAPKAQATCLPEHAAMGHCTLPAKEAAPPKPPVQAQPTCLPEHAAMGHCTLPAPQPAPAAGAICLPEHAAMGHCTPAPSGAAEGTDLPAGTAPPPPVPSDHAGDAVYGTPAMEMGRHHLNEFHGAQKFSQVSLNVFETQFRSGRDGYEWGGDAWYGGDIHRLWMKTEGEGAFGHPVEKAEVQALYSRAVGPYFNLQGGVRYDFKPNPSRIYAVAGFEGLAPSFFDVEGALFLSNKGEFMARLEGYYDQRITQRLILQPSAELNFAAQNSPEIGVGRGLSDAEIGLRLRYDIRREFAPYVGVQYRHAFGATRRYLKAEGEDPAGWSLLTGIRMWF